LLLLASLCLVVTYVLEQDIQRQLLAASVYYMRLYAKSKIYIYIYISCHYAVRIVCAANCDSKEKIESSTIFSVIAIPHDVIAARQKAEI
jgi:hypothetical protein